MTANDPMYIVIKALSQYSDNAINKSIPPTINAVLVLPTINAAPIANVNVAITGIPKYACFIGPRT